MRAWAAVTAILFWCFAFVMQANGQEFDSKLYSVRHNYDAETVEIDYGYVGENTVLVVSEKYGLAMLFEYRTGKLRFTLFITPENPRYRFEEVDVGEVARFYACSGLGDDAWRVYRAGDER